MGMCGRAGWDGQSSHWAHISTFYLLLCLSYPSGRQMLWKYKGPASTSGQSRNASKVGTCAQFHCSSLHSAKKTRKCHLWVYHIWGCNQKRTLLGETDNKFIFREYFSLKIRGSRKERSQGAGMEVVLTDADLLAFGRSRTGKCCSLIENMCGGWKWVGMATENLFCFLQLLLLP